MFDYLDLNFCSICIYNHYEKEMCEKCQGAYDPLNPKLNIVPTKFKSIYEEEKKMIVTIIGSYSKIDEMKKCKEFWKRFGHTVNCPCDPGREEMALITRQSSWIDKIEEADLVVAMPKEIKMEGHGSSRYVYEFGESTSYEMAIAVWRKKPIIVW